MALYGKIRAKLGGKPFCTMVVLAAGSSKRMGRDKLMMEVGGVPGACALAAGDAKTVPRSMS